MADSGDRDSHTGDRKDVPTTSYFPSFYSEKKVTSKVSRWLPENIDLDSDDSDQDPTYKAPISGSETESEGDDKKQGNTKLLSKVKGQSKKKKKKWWCFE